jgi:hypothetical protein
MTPLAFRLKRGLLYVTIAVVWVLLVYYVGSQT